MRCVAPRTLGQGGPIGRATAVDYTGRWVFVGRLLTQRTESGASGAESPRKNASRHADVPAGVTHYTRRCAYGVLDERSAGTRGFCSPLLLLNEQLPGGRVTAAVTRHAFVSAYQSTSSSYAAGEQGGVPACVAREWRSLLALTGTPRTAARCSRRATTPRSDCARPGRVALPSRWRYCGYCHGPARGCERDGAVMPIETSHLASVRRPKGAGHCRGACTDGRDPNDTSQASGVD